MDMNVDSLGYANDDPRVYVETLSGMPRDVASFITSHSVHDVFLTYLYQHWGEPAIELLRDVDHVNRLLILIEALNLVKQYTGPIYKFLNSEKFDMSKFEGRPKLSKAHMAYSLHAVTRIRTSNILSLAATSGLVKEWADDIHKISTPTSLCDVPSILPVDPGIMDVSGMQNAAVISQLVMLRIDDGVIHQTECCLSDDANRYVAHIVKYIPGLDFPSSCELMEMGDEMVASYNVLHPTVVTSKVEVPATVPQKFLEVRHRIVSCMRKCKKRMDKFEDFSEVGKHGHCVYSLIDLELDRVFRGHPLLKNLGKNTRSCLSMFFPGLNTISKWVVPVLECIPRSSVAFAFGHSKKNNWAKFLFSLGVKLQGGDINEFELPKKIVKSEKQDLEEPIGVTAKFDVDDTPLVEKFERVQYNVQGTPLIISDVYFSPDGQNKEIWEARYIKFAATLRSHVCKGGSVLFKIVPSRTIHPINDWFWQLPLVCKDAHVKFFPGGRQHNGEVIVLVRRDSFSGSRVWDEQLCGHLVNFVFHRMKFSNAVRNMLLIAGSPCFMRVTPEEMFASRFIDDSTLGLFTASTTDHMKNVVLASGLDDIQLAFELEEGVTLKEVVDVNSWGDADSPVVAYLPPAVQGEVEVEYKLTTMHDLSVSGMKVLAASKATSVEAQKIRVPYSLYEHYPADVAAPSNHQKKFELRSWKPVSKDKMRDKGERRVDPPEHPGKVVVKNGTVPHQSKTPPKTRYKEKDKNGNAQEKVQGYSRKRNKKTKIPGSQAGNVSLRSKNMVVNVTVAGPT